MAKKPGDSQDAMMAELSTLAGPPDKPDNPGNYPADESVAAAPTAPEPLVVDAQAPETPETPAEPPPDATPLEAPPADAPTEPADAPDADPVAALRLELEELRRAKDDLAREVQFVRAGPSQAPTTPAAPGAPSPDPLIAQALAPFDSITEDAVADFLAGGPKSAEQFRNALKAAVLMAVQVSEQRTLNYLQQRDTHQQQQAESTRTADEWRESFWTAHAPLKPYQELVALKAQEVAREQDQRKAAGRPPMTWDDAGREIVQRTTKTLKDWGVPIPAGLPTPTAAPRAAAPKGARLRPAMSETGNGRTNGVRTITPDEKEMFSLI
jgi:hypothetical protein